MTYPKKISVLIKDKLENWKNTSLTEIEKESWNVINELRNEDTHQSPVKANYEIKKHFITTGGHFISLGNGGFLCTDSKGYYILYEKKEYNIKDLGKDGINSAKKLIDYIRENY